MQSYQGDTLNMCITFYTVIIMYGGLNSMDGVILLEYNNDTEVASFQVSNPDKLALLPTTTSGGQGSLCNLAPINGGDAFCLSNGRMYFLDDEDDEWKEPGYDKQ